MSDFKLVFKGLKEKDGTIAIPLLINKLEILQSLNYLFGEYQEKRPFRTANFGARKKVILGEYTLVLNRIEKGSTELLIQPAGHQSVIDCEDGVYEAKGVRSLNRIHDLMGRIAENENSAEYMAKQIDDSNYRGRIVRLLSELYPREDDTYTIIFENSRGVKHDLDGKTRTKVKKMIADCDYSEDKESLYCPVLEIKMEISKNTGMKSFSTSVDGRKISVPVNNDLFDEVIANAGKVVEIECGCKTDENRDIVEVYNVTKVTKRTSLVIWDINYKNNYYNLKKPLEVKIDSNIEKDENWIIRNEDLEIISMGQKWDETLNAFSEEFDMLVSEYVNSKDALSKGAKELREKIASYLGGSNDN